MPSILLTGPASEPLTLAEAKAFLRVAHDDDDALIGALIASARLHVETQTRRALITQTWRVVRDRWPADGHLWISPAPLRDVVAARVYDAAGAAITIDPQAFIADGAAAPALVSFAPFALPVPGRDRSGIELDVEVGYGDAASDVPEALRHAIRLLLTHWYENRGVVALAQSVAELPAAVGALIAPFRVLSL
jgi:uncharacterized phiE125 gp8 family phage protein